MSPLWNLRDQLAEVEFRCSHRNAGSGSLRQPRRFFCEEVRLDEPLAALVPIVQPHDAKDDLVVLAIRHGRQAAQIAVRLGMCARWAREPQVPPRLFSSAASSVPVQGSADQLGMAVAALTDLGVPLGGETGVEMIGPQRWRDVA